MNPTTDAVITMTDVNDKQQGNRSDVDSCKFYFMIVLSWILVIITFPFSLCFCIRTVQENQRVVIVRLGRVRKGAVFGPGFIFVLPCIDELKIESMVDHHISFPRAKSGEIDFTVDADNESFVKLRAQFVLNDARSEKALACTYWRPKGEVRGAVFLSHGYGSRLGATFKSLAECLVKQSIFVFGHDHVGHGRSSGQRVQADSMDDFVEPVIAHVEAVKKWPMVADKSLFIIGHSMGGLIALFTVSKRADLFKGLIVMAPLIEVDPNYGTPFKKWLARLFHNFLPSFTVGSPRYELDTRDRHRVKKIRKDKLIWHGGVRAGMGYVLLQACDSAINILPDITLPILILQGTEDKIVTPRGAQIVFDNVSSTDKELTLYEGAYHSLYSELPDVKADAIQRTLEFITKRL